jgi:undecaprenyl-diphosphatase
MTNLHAIILSIIEGITEFLPISSTGHLVLAARLLQIPQTEFVKSFEIIIQLGAILAVVVLYWKRFLRNREVWKRVIAAFIPTAIIGFALYKVVKNVLLGNEMVTLLALLLGGIAIIVIEKIYVRKDGGIHAIEKLSMKQAMIIGICQSLSIIPGVSRAASTIMGGMLLHMNRQTAVEFSFLLAIPTMLAASALDIIKSEHAFSPQEFLLLGVGFLASFFVALLAIKYFLSFVKNHTMIPFGIYRIFLSILYWVIVLR